MSPAIPMSSGLFNLFLDKPDALEQLDKFIAAGLNAALRP